MTLQRMNNTLKALVVVLGSSLVGIALGTQAAKSIRAQEAPQCG